MLQRIPDTAIPTDDELLARTKDGDDEAAGLLFWRHRRMVLGIVLHVYGVPSQDADDLLQVVFQRFLSKRATITYPHGFFAVTATWAARNYHRASSRRRRLAEELARQPGNPAPAWRRQEEKLIRRLDMRAAFQTLGDKCRTLLRAIIIERTPHRAYARESGTPFGSIQPTVRRCLAKMRAFIEETKP